MHILLAAVIARLPVFALPARAEAPLILTDGRSDSAPAPLIIVLHGFTGSGRAMQRKTGFDALARAHGFSVAYPSGPHRRWDDSNPTSSMWPPSQTSSPPKLPKVAPILPASISLATRMAVPWP